MLIPGSRLIVSDNSGAKEVQCIKTKGRFAGIGDIITCSVKKATRGKVEQVSKRMSGTSLHCCIPMSAVLIPFKYSKLYSGSSSKGCHSRNEEGITEKGRKHNQV